MIASIICLNGPIFRVPALATISSWLAVKSFPGLAKLVTRSVPVPDTFRWISACCYSMLLSFLGVLVPRTFESKAGPLRQSAGDSITVCWACIPQSNPVFFRKVGLGSQLPLDEGQNGKKEGDDHCAYARDHGFAANELGDVVS